MPSHPSHSPQRDLSKVPSSSLHPSSGEHAGLQFFSVARGARIFGKLVIFIF